MVTANQTFRGRATNDPASNVKITNITILVANTEMSYVLSDNLKNLWIATRGFDTIKYTFTATESGTTFITLKKGTAHEITDINFTGKTFYFQGPRVGTIVELMEFF